MSVYETVTMRLGVSFEMRVAAFEAGVIAVLMGMSSQMMHC
jgi:hypothetical protein